jgi:hypothetical protein
MVLLTPDKDVIARVRAEFGLDEAGMKQAVRAVKHWLHMQPHLPDHCGEQQQK